MVKCAFSNPLFVSDVFLDVLPHRKPRKQSAETLLNWKRCEKLQTSLMHLLILFHVLFTRIYPEGVHTSIILNWNSVWIVFSGAGSHSLSMRRGQIQKSVLNVIFFFFLSFMREHFNWLVCFKSPLVLLTHLITTHHWN